MTRTNVFLVSCSTIPEMPTSDEQHDCVTCSSAACRSAFISCLATSQPHGSAASLHSKSNNNSITTTTPTTTTTHCVANNRATSLTQAGKLALDLHTPDWWMAKLNRMASYMVRWFTRPHTYKVVHSNHKMENKKLLIVQDCSRLIGHISKIQPEQI